MATTKRKTTKAKQAATPKPDAVLAVGCDGFVPELAELRMDGWDNGLPVTKEALEEFRLRTVLDTYAEVLVWTDNGTKTMAGCADPDSGGYGPLAESLRVPAAMLKFETERHMDSEHVTIKEMNELLRTRTAWLLTVDRWQGWNAMDDAAMRRGLARAAKAKEA